MRNSLSNKYISGKGIEIGGKHFPLPVPPGTFVIQVDRMSHEELTKTSDMPPPPDMTIVVDDAEKLAEFPSESLDFVIANHVLEHCRSPLTALGVWHNRLKPGGIVYAAIPEKTFTFDKPRPITPFAHLLEDLETYPNTNDEPHYRDWISTIDKVTGDELENRIRAAVKNETNIHFHVWRLSDMHEIFNWLKPFYDVVEVGNNVAEIIWVLRKR